MSQSSLNLALPILQVPWNNSTSDISHLLTGKSWDSAIAKTEITIIAPEKEVLKDQISKISKFLTPEQSLGGWDFPKWDMTPAEQWCDGLGRRRETRMAPGASLHIPKGGWAEQRDRVTYSLQRPHLIREFIFSSHNIVQPVPAIHIEKSVYRNCSPARAECLWKPQLLWGVLFQNFQFELEI